MNFAWAGVALEGGVANIFWYFTVGVVIGTFAICRGWDWSVEVRERGLGPRVDHLIPNA